MGSLLIVRFLDIGSSWISTYWWIAWEIVDRTGARLFDLVGYLLVVVYLVLWDIHCLGDIEIDGSEVLIIYISIGISIGRLWAPSGDLELTCDIDRDIVRATRSLINIP